MKKLFLMGCAVAVLMMIMTVPMARASYQVTLEGGSGYGPYQAGVGGEFTWIPKGGLDWVLGKGYVEGLTKNVLSTPTHNDKSFQSFCLEGGESISAWGTYDATINAKAINGGLPASTGGDPISKGTAWLYSEFARGTLDGYVYDDIAGRKASAAQLQNAIWWLEGEESIAYNPGNNFMVLVGNTFGAPTLNTNGFVVAVNGNGTGAAESAAPYAYGVGVLNLTQNGLFRQDQLVLVPEPFTLLFLGGCLLGAGMVGRKFQI